MKKLIFSMVFIFLFVYSCSTGENTNNKNDTKGVINSDSSIHNKNQVDVKETSYQAPKCEEGSKVVNPDGKLHGEPCEKNEECKYGFCYKAALTNFKYGICTKWCNCGPNSSCSADDTNEVQYQCYKTFSAEEEVTSYCVPICYSVNDCKKIANFYNDCKIVHGTRKQCLYDPEKDTGGGATDIIDAQIFDTKDVYSGN